MFADEEDSGTLVSRKDLSRRLDTIESRQPDIQQNEIRIERLSFLNRVNPIHGFADDSPMRRCLDG